MTPFPGPQYGPKTTEPVTLAADRPWAVAQLRAKVDGTSSLIVVVPANDPVAVLSLIAVGVSGRSLAPPVKVLPSPLSSQLAVPDSAAPVAESVAHDRG